MMHPPSQFAHGGKYKLCSLFFIYFSFLFPFFTVVRVLIFKPKIFSNQYCLLIITNLYKHDLYFPINKTILLF